MNLIRSSDLLILIGFGFLVIINFHLYIVYTKQQDKLEELTRKVAIKNAKKGKRKSPQKIQLLKKKTIGEKAIKDPLQISLA